MYFIAIPILHFQQKTRRFQNKVIRNNAINNINYKLNTIRNENYIYLFMDKKQNTSEEKGVL